MYLTNTIKRARNFIRKLLKFFLFKSAALATVDNIVSIFPHFFRQENGFRQTGKVLVGWLDFLTPFVA